jgi:hypothetical protein
MEYADSVIKEKIKKLNLKSIVSTAIIIASSKNSEQFYSKLDKLMLDGSINEQKIESVVKSSDLNYALSLIPEEDIFSVTIDVIQVNLELNQNENDLTNLRIIVKLYDTLERNNVELLMKEENIYDELRLYVHKKDIGTVKKLIYFG